MTRLRELAQAARDMGEPSLAVGFLIMIAASLIFGGVWCLTPGNY